MKFKIFSTDDWLARHPKVMLVLGIILFLTVCFLEEIR